MRINLQILATFISGGLAGAVFNWVVNHPRPTTVTYTITTTTLGADSTLKTVLPGLTIQLGGREVPVIHTHTIDFSSPSGPHLDSFEATIFFSRDVQFLGKPLAEASSPAYQISCSDFTNGTKCRMSPVKTGCHYRVTIATDVKSPPLLDTAAKDVELIKAETFLAGSEGDSSRRWPTLVIGSVTGALVIFSLFAWKLASVSNLHVALLAKGDSAIQEALLRDRTKGSVPVLTLPSEEDLTRSKKQSDGRTVPKNLQQQVVEPFEGVGELAASDIDFD